MPKQEDISRILKGELDWDKYVVEKTGGKGITPENYGVLNKEWFELSTTPTGTRYANPNQQYGEVLQPGGAFEESKLIATGWQPTTSAINIPGERGIGVNPNQVAGTPEIKPPQPTVAPAEKPLTIAGGTTTPATTAPAGKLSQQQELDIAYQRKLAGTATPTDEANLAYAQQKGLWKPPTAGQVPQPQQPTQPVQGATQPASQLGRKISNVAELNQLTQQGLTEADIIRDAKGNIYLKPESRFSVGGTGVATTPVQGQPAPSSGIAAGEDKLGLPTMEMGGAGDMQTFIANQQAQQKEFYTSLLDQTEKLNTDFLQSYLNQPSLADNLQRLREEQGLPALEKEITLIDQQVLDTEGLLTKLESDINQRVEGMPVSEAGRRRMLAMEQKPLVETLDELIRGRTRLAAGLGSKEAVIQQAMEAEAADRQRQLEGEKMAMEFGKEKLGAMADIFSSQQQQALQAYEAQVEVASKSPDVIGSGDTGYFQYNSQTGNWDQIIASKNETLSFMGEILSPTEAAALNVPYGTTKGEAMTQNVIPKTQLTPQQKFDFEMKISKMFEQYTKEARGAMQQIGIINNSWNLAKQQIKSGGDMNAVSQGILVTFQKVLDPTSVVRESEYARSGNGQSLLNRIEGYAQTIQKGGAGVTEKTLKEFVNTANEFYKGYANSMSDYAQRAAVQAENYGLNLENILTPEQQGLLSQGQPDFNNLPALNKSYGDVYGLVKDNPAYQPLIETLTNEGLNEQEILQFIETGQQGFNSPLSMGVNGSEVKKIADAIGQFESGGNYKAVGPATSSGDKAYGKYQVMGANISSWAKQALGMAVDVATFLGSPAIQDAVALYKMSELFKKYGNIEDVASVWFSGRPVSKAGNAKDVIGTSVPQYVTAVKNIYNKLG